MDVGVHVEERLLDLRAALVTNWPLGHSDGLRSARILAPSATRRLAYGSGTHTPSMGARAGYAVRVVELSSGTIRDVAAVLGLVQPVLVQPGPQGDVLRVPRAAGSRSSCP